MASDRLFEMLAQAESQPSKAYRTAITGLGALTAPIEGYQTGLEARANIDKYRLLNTPLGSMYSDPSQIPFGLRPEHTVKDLLTIAPAMENYVPPNLIGGAARAFGSNVAPPPVSGSANPAIPVGASNLNTAEGTGAGASGTLPTGTSPTVSVPPGGMGMKGFQNVMLPTLKAGQEERQFGQRQAQTRELHDETLAAEAG